MAGREGQQEHGLGERMIFKQYRGNHHQVSLTPMYFLSLRELLLDEIYARGPVMQISRVFFPQELQYNSGKSDGEFQQRENIISVLWQDKHPVLMLSTLSQPGET